MEQHSLTLSQPYRKSWWSAACVTAAIVLGLTGCSGEEKRTYKIPPSLCGVPLESDLISPFLPPGSTISVSPSTPVDGTERCTVRVDGESVMIASQEWWDEASRATPQKVASAHAHVEPNNISEDGRYVHSSRGAAWQVSCREPQRSKSELFIVIQIPESGTPDEDSMKRLAKAYAEEVASSDKCVRNH
ncbi:hypothetical protein KBZ10_07510 [Streptomyces sp. F63]|uniref:hypothetical protein n=1 Tax=Streptomyces sp. F63 TaxID=2824887 RepID=UPI001B358F15|nr:hypothetical protein [Streptomyces sp. F63]MBQ0984368.1 hypothetical protein [Streptomyces sp. F63]